MADDWRAAVRQRAQARCEYCQMPEEFLELAFQVDHIIAQKHHGADDPENFAWSCYACNNHKQADIAGIDPDGDPLQVIRLFHPRRDRWNDHFSWRGAILAARSAIGRVTIYVLGINLSHRVALRQLLIDEGVFPPAGSGQPE